MKRNNASIGKEGITRQLTQYVTDLDYRQIPSEVIHAAKRCLLDWLGVALGGSFHQGVDHLLYVTEEVGTQAKAIIIGRRRKADILHAALINGYMSHVLDYDDTNLESFVHASAPVWPAIASLSAIMRISGTDALSAFVLGYELENRIGRVLFPHHDERGWHMTAMVGGFGAAAATGKLLRLDAGQLSQALGIVATYSSGLREMFGTMSKSLHIGKAAMSGLYASLLARSGFTSSEKVLETPRGFFAVNAGERAIGMVVARLGDGFEILQNSFKPYSCGVVTHPIIDAVVNLRNREGVESQDVVAIEAEVNTMVPDVTGKKSPTTGLDGKFSIYHCIGAALVDGACGPDQFSDERVNDPDIISIRKRASIRVNPGFRKHEARVRITLGSGRRLEEHIPFARGTPQNPLTDEKLTEKYHSMAESVLGSKGAQELAEKAWAIDEVDDFQEIIRLTSPSQ